LILEWQPGRQRERWSACVDLLLELGYTHLLACSSLAGSGPLLEPLNQARLEDPRFVDNVLVHALPWHAALLGRLEAS
jgi:hypothetical protein